MVSNYLSFEYSSRGVESQLNSNYLNSNGIPIILSLTLKFFFLSFFYTNSISQTGA